MKMKNNMNEMDMLAELHQLLLVIKDKDNYFDYEYLRYLVQSNERDHMGLLLKQLEKMRKEEE